METIKGVVKRVIFQNEESGFKVLKVKIPSGPVLTFTGEFGPEIINGTVADFHGDYKAHPKYGTNFRVSSYDISHNAQELASIRLFLGAISPNIGPERAQYIVDYFGSETIDILDKEPFRLQEVEGIGRVSAESLGEAWQKNRNKWQHERQEYTLRAFLNSLGIKERRVKKIIKYFGGGLKAEETIRENPYKLTEIEGFGFSTADFIAKQLGVLESDPLRLQAFIYYAINILCRQNGHLYLAVADCVELINKYSRESNTYFLAKRIIIDNDIAEPIKNLIDEKIVIADRKCLYSVKNYTAETESASRIVSILNEESDLITLTRDFIDEHIANFERENRITLSEEQREALHYFVEKKVFAITGCPGTGKCLGYDTPILMYDGTIKKVQDIKKNNLLMGDDSKPRTVLSVSRGKEHMYEVRPVKGDSYRVNESHILSLKESGETGHKKGKIVDIPFKKYLKLSEHKKHHLKGYRVPVTFPYFNLKLDPYLLGFWLGNGDNAGARISTPFFEVIAYLSEMVLKWGLSVKKIKGDNVDYGITCDRESSVYNSLPDKRKPNSFLNTLREYNLLFNKHIPLEYKVNGKKNRLKLLAGLIDSDGYLDRGTLYEVTFKSKILADDTAYVARSLGFSAYVRPCEKSWDCVRKGKRYRGKGVYYRMHISGNGLEEIPCIVSKKRAKKRKQKKDVLVTGIKVIPTGIGNYYGFEIDGNGRFLLGDFTVTHNTTVLKAIVDLVKKLKLDLTCMTPTGISAKKMASTIDYNAYTIHRRLGFRGDHWKFGELEKYETDVVIIDETSMVDQEVFYRLLCALKNRVHLIFVGDSNQLPSVGAGNVLKELINCGEIPTVNLEKIFRQDEASDIIKAAHKIKNGETDLSLFKSDPQADCFFIRETNTDTIENYVIKLAQRFKEEPEPRGFQIITPRNDGPLSVNMLNDSLQAVLNPGPKTECLLGKFIVRNGDRVIITKNDYELDIFNGEIGKVIGIDSSKITIKLDDKVVEIGKEIAIERIKLAYALTVHRMQGQEYPYIILPFINQFGRNMLQRNLLYTAITRAKTKVIIIGHGSALEKAIDNSSVQRRNTNLGERIKECSQNRRRNSLPIQHGELADYLPVLREKEPSLLKADELHQLDTTEKS